MSDTLAEKNKYKGRPRKTRAVSELDECRAWLENLGYQSAPKMHVNGAAYPTAVMVVDFGTPLNEPFRLSADQSAELIGMIRSNTKAMFRDREVNIRVQSDSNTGIWWSSVA